MFIMKRLAIVVALAVPLVVLAVDAPFYGIIIAANDGARNQADTATPFTIPQGQCVIVNCVNDAGAAANAFIKWTNTWADAGATSRHSWSVMANDAVTCGGSGGAAPYQVLSIMGNAEPVFCHVTASNAP